MSPVMHSEWTRTMVGCSGSALYDVDFLQEAGIPLVVGAWTKSVEGAGADSVSLINTITGMAIDAQTRRPILANITGGLSGPAIKPIALRMVWQGAGEGKIPVIGVGGIMHAEDAVEFLIAGATAVQVGTANFINPRAAQDIVEGIEIYLRENRLECLDDLIGSLCID